MRGGPPDPARRRPARTNRGLLVMAMGLTLLLPGCRRREAPDTSTRVVMRVRPDPPVVGLNTIEFVLEDSTGHAIRGAEVAIEGNMTHPGMTPRFGVAKETSPGTYRAVLELTMAGDWVILMEARLAGGATVRRRLSLPGVRVG